MQVSNGYINGEGSSAGTCCHMLSSAYQRPADHKAELCNVGREIKLSKIMCSGVENSCSLKTM